jgi:uncharacterized glyoxalase superfamily protein PhnB
MSDPAILGTVPVIPVTDVAAAIGFYADTLGFTLAFQQGEYAGVERGAAHLHLDGVVNAAAGQVTVRIAVEGVDALYSEIEPQGVVDPAEPLNTKPWGARQFSVLDLCGNRITFVEGA